MTEYSRGTVLDVRGEPITSARKKAAMMPVESTLPSSERRLTRRAISPAWLRGVMDSAALGRPRDFVDFLDLAREDDDRISSLCERVEGVTSSLPWAVIPAPVEESGQNLAAEIAAACEDMLRQIVYDPGSIEGRGGFEDLLCARAAGFYTGWSVQQREWAYRDGQLVPSVYLFMHPHRFVWGDGQGTDMLMRLYDPGSQTEAGIYPGVLLDPMRYTVTRGLIRPGYPARDGLGRPAAWLFAYKNFSWKDLVQASEQFGTPWVFGIVGGGKGEGEWDDDANGILRGIVKNIHGMSRGVYSGKDKIEVVTPAAAKGTLIPKEIVDMCNDGLSVIFVGATQGVEIRDKGTYASATVHEGVELRKVRRYALTLSQATQQSDVIPWFRLNYSVGDEYCPTVWLQAEESTDLEAEMRIDRELQRAGVPLTRSYFYDRYNRPAPDDDTGDDIAEPTGGGEPFGQMPMTALPSGPAVALAAKPEDLGEDIEEAVHETYTSHVEEYVKVADKAATAARSEATDIATTWIKDQSVDPGARAFAEEIFNVLSPGYQKVMAQGKFQPVVEAIYESYKLDVTGWPKGVSFDFSGTDIMFSETLGEIDTVYISQYVENEAAKSSVQSFLKRWYGEQGGGVFGKNTSPEIIADFRRALGGNLTKMHDWQIRRIIDTSVARTRGYSELKQAHDAYIEEMEWYAQRTERTCAICRRLHGTIVRVDKVYAHAVAEMELGADAYIQALKGRKASHPLDPDVLKDLDNAGKAKFFEQHGWQIPAHPHCACMWLVRLPE